MAHAQKPDFVFRRNGRVHLNRRGRQFSRLLAAEVCASAVVMLDIPCSEVVWRVLATYSTRQFSLHFPSASPCATVRHHISTGLYIGSCNPFEAHATRSLVVWPTDRKRSKWGTGSLVQQRLPGIPKLFHFTTCGGSKDSLFSAFVDISSDLHPETNGTLHQPSYYDFSCGIGHRILRYVRSKQVGLNDVVVYL
jgi:hypothetical protein